MNKLTPLQRGLLELGLEDWIPLAQIRGMSEVRDVMDDERAFEELSPALLDLLERGLIQVWSGYWDDEPEKVEPTRARRLLMDERNYSYDEEAAHGRPRVYFVNVDNVVEAPGRP